MPAFSTEGVDHVALAVADLDRSEAFYRDVLGLERVYEQWDPPRVLASGGSGVALFPAEDDYGEASPAHILHIALRVDRRNFEAAQEALSGRRHRVSLLRPRHRALDLLRGSRRLSPRADDLRGVSAWRAGLHTDAVGRVAERVRELRGRLRAAELRPRPRTPTRRSSCARSTTGPATGARYLVGGRGPFEGSALLWAVGLQAAERRRGLLTAAALRDVERRARRRAVSDRRRDRRRPRAPRGAVARPRRRAGARPRGRGRGAAGRRRRPAGRRGRPARAAGALRGLRRPAGQEVVPVREDLRAARLARRSPTPRAGRSCADNVLMRLALRSGLVEPGLARRGARRRPGRRSRQVADGAGISPPVLDDMLWELGRDDPDLLGTEGGDLREPPRDPASAWY